VEPVEVPDVEPELPVEPVLPVLPVLLEVGVVEEEA
jgi:hypothetical protein